MITFKKISASDINERKRILINTLTPNLKFNDGKGKLITAINTYLWI